MNLGIAYNVFDGLELLEGSIKSVRNCVDYIVVVYSTISNFKNQSNIDVKKFVTELLDKKLISNVGGDFTKDSINEIANEGDDSGYVSQGTILRNAWRHNIKHGTFQDSDITQDIDKIDNKKSGMKLVSDEGSKDDLYTIHNQKIKYHKGYIPTKDDSGIEYNRGVNHYEVLPSMSDDEIRLRSDINSKTGEKILRISSVSDKHEYTNKILEHKDRYNDLKLGVKTAVEKELLPLNTEVQTWETSFGKIGTVGDFIERDNNSKQYKLPDGKEVVIKDKNNVPTKKIIWDTYKNIPDDKNIPIVFETKEQYLKEYIKNQEIKHNHDFPKQQENEYIKKELVDMKDISARYTTKKNKYIEPRTVFFTDLNWTPKSFSDTAKHETGHEIYERNKNIKQDWKSVNKNNSPTLYGTTDKEEDFADSYKLYKNGTLKDKKRKKIIRDNVSHDDIHWGRRPNRMEKMEWERYKNMQNKATQKGYENNINPRYKMNTILKYNNEIKKLDKVNSIFHDDEWRRKYNGQIRTALKAQGYNDDDVDGYIENKTRAEIETANYFAQQLKHGDSELSKMFQKNTEDLDYISDDEGYKRYKNYNEFNKTIGYKQVKSIERDEDKDNDEQDIESDDDSNNMNNQMPQDKFKVLGNQGLTNIQHNLKTKRLI